MDWWATAGGAGAYCVPTRTARFELLGICVLHRSVGVVFRCNLVVHNLCFFSTFQKTGKFFAVKLGKFASLAGRSGALFI